jgi:hypothetical protein
MSTICHLLDTVRVARNATCLGNNQVRAVYFTGQLAAIRVFGKTHNVRRKQSGDRCLLPWSAGHCQVFDKIHNVPRKQSGDSCLQLVSCWPSSGSSVRPTTCVGNNQVRAVYTYFTGQLVIVRVFGKAHNVPRKL